MSTYEIVGNDGKLDEVEAESESEALEKHLRDVGYDSVEDLPDHVDAPEARLKK